MEAKDSTARIVNQKSQRIKYIKFTKPNSTTFPLPRDWQTKKNTWTTAKINWRAEA